MERRFIEAAAAKESSEGLRDLGLSALPLAAFLRAGGIERARRVLGMTIDQFQEQQEEAEKGGSRHRAKR